MKNEIDPLIKARPICEMLGNACRRTLYEMVKRGDFPPPDRKAQKRGEPDLWRLSTAKRGIENYARTARA